MSASSPCTIDWTTSPCCVSTPLPDWDACGPARRGMVSAGATAPPSRGTEFAEASASADTATRVTIAAAATDDRSQMRIPVGGPPPRGEGTDVASTRLGGSGLFECAYGELIVRDVCRNVDVVEDELRRVFMLGVPHS